MILGYFAQDLGQDPRLWPPHSCLLPKIRAFLVKNPVKIPCLPSQDSCLPGQDSHLPGQDSCLPVQDSNPFYSHDQLIFKTRVIVNMNRYFKEYMNI